MKRRIGLTLFALALAGMPFAAGCGGAMAERREEPQPDARAQMNEQEARLRAAQQELEEAGPACEGRCRASTSICDAAHRICQLASDLGDETSRARCARADASCSDATTATTECACTPASEDAGRVSVLGATHPHAT
ncbi:MAG: hypothetical protein U0234_21240 [Sandaracinus sp.]